jgi:hypothetical protein
MMSRVFFLLAGWLDWVFSSARLESDVLFLPCTIARTKQATKQRLAGGTAKRTFRIVLVILAHACNLMEAKSVSGLDVAHDCFHECLFVCYTSFIALCTCFT